MPTSGGCAPDRTTAATWRPARRRPPPERIDEAMATPGSATGERRIALWLAAVAALAYLPFDHCHFTASDELGVFDPAVALYTHGTLAVPSGVHVFWGRDGRLYSHFAIGQSVL